MKIVKKKYRFYENFIDYIENKCYFCYFCNIIFFWIWNDSDANFNWRRMWFNIIFYKLIWNN